MKKLILAAVLCVLTAGTSLAAVSLDGGFFTATAPDEEWTVTELEGGARAITSPDHDVVITVLIIENANVRDTASVLSAAHSAKSLVVMDELGTAYEYIGSSIGKPLYCQVFDAGRDSVGCISVIGNWKSPDASSVFNSITLSAE